MDNVEAMEVVSDLCSQQWGLITTAQARNEGVAPHVLRRFQERGSLQRVRHGVYASSSTAPSSELEIQAQWLSLDPGLMAADRLYDPSLAAEAVVSHTTAAEIWGIGDLWTGGIHFTVNKRRQSRQPGVHFHRAELQKDDWTLHPTANLPITTAARTIADLARAGYEPDHLLDMVGDAATGSLVQKDELLDALDGLEEAFGAREGKRRELEKIIQNEFPVSKALRDHEKNMQNIMARQMADFSSATKAIELQSAEMKKIMASALDAISPTNQKLLENQGIASMIKGLMDNNKPHELFADLANSLAKPQLPSFNPAVINGHKHNESTREDSEKSSSDNGRTEKRSQTDRVRPE